MAGEHREPATGIIKKIFPKKAEPFGFVKLLTPLESRGEEAVFYFKDMLLKPFEKKLLYPGLLLQFYIKEKPDDFMQSFVPFRALELKPVDPAEHTASVIRAAESKAGGKQLMVCVELTLTRALITHDSYQALQLRTPLLPGDTCIVRISWREMLDAFLNAKLPIGEIIAVTNPSSNLSIKRSMSSEQISDRTTPAPSPQSPNESLSSTIEIASDEETSSETDRELQSRQSRGSETVPMRRRCRSASERPTYDTSMLPPGMCCSHKSRGQMPPFGPMNPFMHPDMSDFHPVMNSTQCNLTTDPSQPHMTMNQTQCHPSFGAPPYHYPGVNPAHWLPPSGPNSRLAPQMKMSLREYLERGGKIF